MYVYTLVDLEICHLHNLKIVDTQAFMLLDLASNRGHNYTVIISDIHRLKNIF